MKRKKHKLRDRIRYWIDNEMSKGLIVKVRILFLITLIVVVVSGVVVVATVVVVAVIISATTSLVVVFVVIFVSSFLSQAETSTAVRQRAKQIIFLFITRPLLR